MPIFYTNTASINNLLITGSGVSMLGTMFGSFSGSFTGSFLGTIATASYITGSAFNSTNPVMSASYALTASYALNAAGTSTTINSNADNRLITGDSAANTLNAESNLTFNGSTLAVTGNVTATSFTGSLQGTASRAAAVNIEINNISADNRVLFTTSQPGGIINIDGTSTDFTYNPSTNTLKGLSAISSSTFFSTQTSGVGFIGSASYAVTAAYALSGVGGSSIFTINGASFNANGEPLVLTGSNGLVVTITDATTNLTASFGFPTNAQVTLGGVTGSLFGTSSWARNVVTASYVTGSIFSGNNSVLSASYAVTAAYALSGVGGTPITFTDGKPPGVVYTNLSAIYVTGSGVVVTSPGSGIVTMSIAGVPAGSGTTFAAGNVDNRIVTATGNTPGELNGEVSLSFDGSNLRVTGSVFVTGNLFATASWATNTTKVGLSTATQFVNASGTKDFLFIARGTVTTVNAAAAVSMSIVNYPVFGTTTTLDSIVIDAGGAGRVVPYTLMGTLNVTTGGWNLPISFTFGGMTQRTPVKLSIITLSQL